MSQPNPHRDEPQPDVTRAAESRPDEPAAVTDGPRPYVGPAESRAAAHRAPEPPATAGPAPTPGSTPAHAGPAHAAPDTAAPGAAPANAPAAAPANAPAAGPANAPGAGRGDAPGAVGVDATAAPGAAPANAPTAALASPPHVVAPGTTPGGATADGGPTAAGGDGAHRTVQLPRESAAEVTTEIAPVPADGTPGADVPLLDLLAPREPGASPYTAPQPEPYRPVAGDYQPLSGSGWDGGYPDAGANTAYTGAADPHARQPHVASDPYATSAAYGPSGYGPDQHVAPPRRAGGRRPQGRRPGPGGRRRVGAGVVAGLAAAVLLLGVIAVWALTSGPPDDDDPTGSGGGAATSAPRTSTVLVADGYQFTQAATRNDTDCVGNAYGKVADFFRETPCAALDRALYTTTVDGRPAVVSVSVVRMPDDAGATELQKLADTSGTGNVADLLRAGVTVPGGPSSFSSAGYASERDGSMVIITEADFAEPSVDDPDTLDRLSQAALQLRP